MTRLPKKYFKSISDYVKTYYTAYGAQRAQRLYDAVKTVTKDFTRTDPVYVRIGEDGEPEIHYAMTQADGSSYFKGMDLGNATISVSAPSVTNAASMFYSLRAKSIAVTFAQRISCVGLFEASTARSIELKGEFALGGNTVNVFYKNINLASITIGNNYALTKNSDGLFYGCTALKEVPAFDMSAVSGSLWGFPSLTACTAFHATGVRISMSLSSTALKHDAILEVFNNLGEVDATTGITLTLGAEKLALMSDEEKAIATGKGWVLA